MSMHPIILLFLVVSVLFGSSLNQSYAKTHNSDESEPCQEAFINYCFSVTDTVVGVIIAILIAFIFLLIEKKSEARRHRGVVRAEIGNYMKSIEDIQKDVDCTKDSICYYNDMVLAYVIKISTILPKVAVLYDLKDYKLYAEKVKKWEAVLKKPEPTHERITETCEDIIQYLMYNSKWR